MKWLATALLALTLAIGVQAHTADVSIVIMQHPDGFYQIEVEAPGMCLPDTKECDHIEYGTHDYQRVKAIVAYWMEEHTVDVKWEA